MGVGGVNQIQSYCQEFDVSLAWAKERRLAYIESELTAAGDEIARLTSLQERCRNQVEKILVQRSLDQAFKEYHRLEHQIHFLKYGPREGGITDEMIEQARDYPIVELIGVANKGNIRCPFHDDKHPSASIKDNRLHCFACNKTWNPIDYLIEKEAIRFKEAVSRLSARH